MTPLSWNRVERRFRVYGWTLEESLFTPVGAARALRGRPGPNRDLVGMRFGLLLVLAYAGPDGSRKTTWMCRCQCDPVGERVMRVLQSNLISGISRSCGCLRRRVAAHNYPRVQKKRGPRPDLGAVVAEMRAARRKDRAA